MNEEKQYTIRNLDELNEINERTFSKLGRISFELPNGELVNERAEDQALRILYNRAEVFHLYGQYIQFIRNKYYDEPPMHILFKMIFMDIPVLNFRARKARIKSYRQFCELRDKINEAYKMPTNYRSYPVLEERIIGD